MPVVLDRAKMAHKSDPAPSSTPPQSTRAPKKEPGESFLDSLPVPPAVAIAGALLVLLIVCVAGYYVLAGGGPTASDTGPSTTVSGPAGAAGRALPGAEGDEAALPALRRGRADVGLE